MYIPSGVLENVIYIIKHPCDNLRRNQVSLHSLHVSLSAISARPVGHAHEKP